MRERPNLALFDDQFASFGLADGQAHEQQDQCHRRDYANNGVDDPRVTLLLGSSNNLRRQISCSIRVSDQRSDDPVILRS